MIKHFIYLDPQKMYSLSSQIFEGVTEFIVSENENESEDSETQKGPVGSGKVLADVIKSSNKSTEKRFLHDYSYTIFESHLIDKSMVLEYSIPYGDTDEFKKSIEKYSFIKVKARAIFNDINKITELFNEFNSIGEAITTITYQEQIEKLRLELESLKSSTGDRNEKVRLEQEFKRLSNISKLSKENGLYQDPKFMEKLSLLTKYGFSDQFEIHQYAGELLFTSCLKREFLREKEDILIKKYSRKTEREIVVLGVISQAFSTYKPEVEGDKEINNLKSVLLNIVEHLSNMENSISGKQNNEIVIDPIAAYFEL